MDLDVDRGRRAVMVAGTLAAGVAALPRAARAAQAGVATRAIPSSGEAIPVIGLGTWQSFDVGERGEAAEEARIGLETFVDGGGRVVDTSPMYGRAEEALGRIAQAADAQERLFLATKIWTRGSEDGARQLAQSRRLLQRETLDLVQVHNLLDVDAHLATLRYARERGELRYIGITHYTARAHDALAARIRTEPLDFVQVNYSLAEPEADDGLLQLAADRGVAVLINRPFAEGALFRAVRGRPLPPVAAELGCNSAAQLFLKWILAEPAVTCVLTGTRDPRHVADNLGAARGPLPTPAQKVVIQRWYEGV